MRVKLEFISRATGDGQEIKAGTILEGELAKYANRFIFYYTINGSAYTLVFSDGSSEVERQQKWFNCFCNELPLIPNYKRDRQLRRRHANV
jgi:hypothetical protein